MPIAPPTGHVRAIETTYAGCRFRSRLEARWAVVFDHLGIRWQYEPEGLDIDGVQYLPDFLLPDLDGLYVEVKGQMGESGMRKVLALANQSRSVVVLADVPEPGSPGPHHTLYLRDGSGLRLHRVIFMQVGPRAEWTLMPFGWPSRPPVDMESDSVVSDELDRFQRWERNTGFVLATSSLADGFRAGRSARFEFGESG